MSTVHTNLSPNGDILIVDDTPASLKLLADILTEAGFHVRPASDGELALRSVQAKLPDLILLDIKMPGLDGYEVCRILKESEESQGIPIIFISALGETEDKVKAFAMGGVDYISKPFDSDEVLARVRTHLDIQLMKRQLEKQNVQLQEKSVCLQEAIEQREEIQKTLEHAEKHFRQLYEQAPLPYQSLDRNGRIIEVNAEWLNTLGYSREEVIGRLFSDFLPPELKKDFKHSFSRFIEKGNILSSEREVVKKDGSTIIAFFTGRTTCNEQGNFIQTQCIFSDITERKQMFNALKESEALYSYLYNNLSDAVFIIGPDGYFLDVNDVAIKRLGYSREEFLHMTPQDINAPEYAARVKERIQQVHKEGHIIFEVVHVAKDGSHIQTEVNATSIQYKGKQAILSLARDITERKLFTDKLQESEEQYRELVESTGDLITRVDGDGKFYYVNLVGEKVFGLSPDKLKGMSAFDFIHPDDQETARSWFLECVSSKVRHSSIENRQVNQNTGGIRHILWTSNFYYDESGKFIKITGIGHDITERKKTEEVLERLRLQQERILTAAGEGIFGLDADGITTFVNPAAETMLGWKMEEIIGHDHHQLVHHSKVDGEPYSKEECPLHASIADGSINQGDNEVFWKKDGTSFPVEYISTPIIADDGIYGAVITFTDITERLQEEQERKQLTEQLSMLLESLPVVVYTRKCNGNFDVTFTSSRVKGITGFFQEQFVTDGAFWEDHLHPEDKDRVIRDLPLVLDTGKEFDSYRFKTMDGSYKWFGCTRRLVKNEDGTNSHIVGTWQDITKQKNMEMESEQRLQQVIQADKLAALGEVVAGVAHEINNPNSFISYNIPVMEEIWQVLDPLIDRKAEVSQNILKGLTIDEYCQDMLDIIQSIKSGSERINKVVNNLKDFARLDEGSSIAEVNVNEVVEKAYTIVGGQVRKSVGNVVLHLADNIPTVPGHFQKLEQVVANILINAAHSISKKGEGKISISTRYVARLKAVIVDIEDNGEGMTSDTASRIFEPFFTTRRNDGGTGLGLSVSYGIIQEHNGTIGMLSREGVGTRFSLIVPLDRRRAQFNLQPTLLFVGGEEKFSSLKLDISGVKESGTYIGHEGRVLTVNKTEDVMGYLDDYPDVDIVVIMLKSTPVASWELLEKIKKRSPLLTVILLVDENKDLYSYPTSYQADFLLHSPFDIKKFYEIIGSIQRMRI